MDPNNLLIGQTIDSYQIQSHLARGGMADVYLAEDVNLKRPVALKVMLPVLAADTNYVERFRREARTVAQLSHPNIVQVFSTGLTPGGRPFIVMQFIDGGSLRDKLQILADKGKLLTTVQALNIARQVALALSLAHKQNIVHRDLKPGNVLVRPDGTPVLVDLGIAAVASSAGRLTQTGNIMGTPDYMSPEQVRDQPLDGRSDLYSLGIILYEMLGGQRPFHAEESIAVLFKQVNEEPAPLGSLRPDLTPATREIVHTLLQKDPNRRYQQAADLVAAIDGALVAEGAAGPSTSATQVLTTLPDADLLSRQQLLYAASPTTRKTDSPTVPSARPRRLAVPLWVIVTLVVLVAGIGLLLIFDDGPSFSTTAVTNQPGSSAPTPQSASPATTVAQNLPATPAATAAQPTTPPTAQPTATDVPQPTATPSPPPEPTVDPNPTSIEIGRSVNGTAIQAVQFGSGPRRLLFVGGLHAGFAPATVDIANLLVDYLANNPQAIPTSTAIIVIPNANPDSTNAPGQLNGRLNANGVDLNRNWDCRWTTDAQWRGNVIPGSGGPAPLSEPESRALHDFIVSQPPAAVVFWEARAANGLAAPGVCGASSRVSGPLALSYGFAAGYPVSDFENLTNQELNGDVTNWLDDQDIPALAVLLPDYDDVDWGRNLAGIQAILQDFGQ